MSGLEVRITEIVEEIVTMLSVEDAEVLRQLRTQLKTTLQNKLSDVEIVGARVRVKGITAAPIAGGRGIWNAFQRSYPAYLASNKKTVPFVEMSTATGLKYQELKAQGEEAVLAFIAQYPPLPKVKKSKAKGATVVTETPVAI